MFAKQGTAAAALSAERFESGVDEGILQLIQHSIERVEGDIGPLIPTDFAVRQRRPNIMQKVAGCVLVCQSAS